MINSRLLRLSASLMLIATMLLAGCDSKPKQKAPKLGSDFTLRDVYENEFKLSDYRGKVVMIEFWATWCPPCRDSIPELIKLHEQYKDKDFKLFAISLDEDTFALYKFVESNKLPYTVLIGDKDVEDRYGAHKIPMTFLLDKKGTVVKKHMGFAQGISNDIAMEIEELLKQQ